MHFTIHDYGNIIKNIKDTDTMKLKKIQKQTARQGGN